MLDCRSSNSLELHVIAYQHISNGLSSSIYTPPTVSHKLISSPENKFHHLREARDASGNKNCE